MAQQITSEQKEIPPQLPLDGLIDDMLACYVEWHLRAGAVAETYREWSSALRAERASRFSAYIAALDQEEATATEYALAVKQVERRFQDQ